MMYNNIFYDKIMLSAVTRIPSPDLGVADSDMISPNYVFLKILLQVLFPPSSSKWKLKNTIQLSWLGSWTLKRFSQKKKMQGNNHIK